MIGAGTECWMMKKKSWAKLSPRRRLAAIILLPPALHDNYHRVAAGTYPWSRTANPEASV